MRHVDPETLALLALGDDSAHAEDHEHLDVCWHCRTDLEALTRTVTASRTVRPEDFSEAPDPRVWQRIQAELELPSQTAVTSAPVPAPAPVPILSAAPRRRSRWPMLAAASVALVVGLTAGTVWRMVGSGAGEASTVASATLDALPDWPGATGAARVEDTPGGDRQIEVSLDGPEPSAGYREVWLMTDDGSGLVSIGILDGSDGRFDIPSDLDLARYPLVDVSEESFDGDPGHSGDSIVRGALQ